MIAYVIDEDGSHGPRVFGTGETDEGIGFETYNDVIGSHMFDMVRRSVGGKDYTFTVDDEGLLTGRMPVARGVHDGVTVETLVGTLVIVGMPDGEGWCQTLTDEDIENIASHIDSRGRLTYAF